MKLSRLLLVGFASIALAGCSLGKKDGDAEYDLNPTINGGSKEEKTAILEALNNKPICMKNGTSSSEIFYDATPILMEDEGDNVKLTVKQVVNGLTVDISWDVPQQDYFDKLLKPETDQNHWFIQLAYKGYEYGKAHGDGSLTWSISKMQCGDAVAENPGVSYHATVKNEQYYHDDMSIAQCYAFKDEVYKVTIGEGEAAKEYKFPSTFDLVDYSSAKIDSKGKLSPYYKTNNPDAVEKQYYYVNVTGKCIYLAPDGNFGLIADGDDVMEIYAGGGTALKTSNWPNLAVGKVVKVVGNLGQYCGNVQLGFITQVKEGDASKIKEPTMAFHEMTEEKIASLVKEGFKDPSQAVKVDGINMMGSLRSVTGTLVPGSIKWCDGDADSAASWKDATAETVKKAKRFKFKLAVGAKEYTVAYDYHSTRNETGTNTVFEKLVSKLGGTGSMTVKGFSRYFGNNSEPFSPEGNGGVWEVLPWSAEHVL